MELTGRRQGGDSKSLNTKSGGLPRSQIFSKFFNFILKSSPNKLEYYGCFKGSFYVGALAYAVELM